MLDLTGLPALDLAIGLAFIFFLLSTLAATIQEFIAAILGLRARTLEQGLRSLLEDPERGWAYVDEFYDHALIKSLYRTPPPAVLRDSKAKVPAKAVQRRHAEAAAQPQPPADEPMPNDETRRPTMEADQEGAPEAGLGKNADTQLRGWFQRALAFFKRTNGPSYISPRAFALVVLDNVAPSDGQKTLFDESISVLAELPDSLGARLKPLITDAQQDVERLRTKTFEAWYDSAVARSRAGPARETQIILIVIGIVLVPAINANTIAMADGCGTTTPSALRSSRRLRRTPRRRRPRSSPTPRTTSTKWSRSGSPWVGAARRCPMAPAESRWRSAAGS